ncbi:uncharacterized protein LOC109705633 isoform X2 [Ananas comosus]|uniref:Uncharacterized protein LOC109705633 isoform X2 n=1 Tax=Ananas comosus TaxID=4615 RepID=A0A6P5EF12_ANACO|nr:uncharacterized protein LOC109705633 isoform X2 [Ananas comosus]
MPGPGAHMMYALGAGAGLMRVSRGRFGPHHCLVYAANAFLGPDLGSFAEWLSSSSSSFARSVGSLAMSAIHHPLYYPLLLGLPLSLLYSSLSLRLLRSGLLHSPSGENGHSSTYTWVLSTGWWKGPAPINPDAVVVVGLLCTFLIGGFIYINRVKHEKSIISKSNQSLRLVLGIAILYCMWCASQIYLRNPPQPAIGEEADLGVIIFLGIYFFLPHSFLILSMNQRDYADGSDQLPQ